MLEDSGQINWGAVSLSRQMCVRGTSRQLREKMRLSLSEVAAALEVSAPSLSRWERGLTLPGPGAASRYGELLQRLRDASRPKYRRRRAKPTQVSLLEAHVALLRRIEGLPPEAPAPPVNALVDRPGGSQQSAFAGARWEIERLLPIHRRLLFLAWRTERAHALQAVKRSTVAQRAQSLIAERIADP